MKNNDNGQNSGNSSTVDSPSARPRMGVRFTLTDLGVRFTLKRGGNTFKYQWRRKNRKLFYVRTGVIKKFSSSIGQCAFPRVAMRAWHLEIAERGSCKRAQRSTRITNKLKSVPETFRSIRIKEYDKKKKKFPVFNKVKNRDPV